MAFEIEDCHCWQCSNYVNVSPEFMNSIKILKEKRKKTDEDGIIQDAISKGNPDMEDKNVINDILEYAVGMSYINKSTYGDHNTYKINLEITDKRNCKACGETIVPFNCDTFNVDPETKYIDVKIFELLAQEIMEIKKYLSKNIETMETTKVNNNILQDKIDELLEICKDKDKTINILTDQLTKSTETMESRKRDANNIADNWQTVNSGMHNDNYRNRFDAQSNLNIPLHNRFNPISVDDHITNADDAVDEDNSHDINYKNSDDQQNQTNNNKPKANKSTIYTNKYPEGNILPSKNAEIPLQNNSLPLRYVAETIKKTIKKER